MRKPVAVVLMIVCVATAVGCSRERDEAAQTGTIAPATPEPGGTTTDAVTTQTVDVGDTERSPAEGAGATAEPDTTTRPK